MQDYKSLCAAAMVCVSLVNMQTDADRQHLSAYMNSSDGRAKNPNEHELSS